MTRSAVRWSVGPVTLSCHHFSGHILSARKLKLGRMVEQVNTLNYFEDGGRGSPLAPPPRGP